MGYYIGQFYFDKRELFLILCLVLLGVAIYFGYPIPIFKPQQLFVLLLLLLFSKAIIPSAKDTPVFLAFLVSLFLTLILPFFSVILFLFISLLTLKILRAV